jgi:hypothetical protein
MYEQAKLGQSEEGPMDEPVGFSGRRLAPACVASCTEGWIDCGGGLGSTGLNEIGYARPPCVGSS